MVQFLMLSLLSRCCFSDKHRQKFMNGVYVKTTFIQDSREIDLSYQYLDPVQKLGHFPASWAIVIFSVMEILIVLISVMEILIVEHVKKCSMCLVRHI